MRVLQLGVGEGIVLDGATEVTVVDVTEERVVVRISDGGSERLEYLRVPRPDEQPSSN
jgi:hypothetical protein